MKINILKVGFTPCALASVLFAAGAAQAQTTPDPIAITLAGNTSYDGWNNLTAANYPGFPGFPGTGNWPHPITANTPGSGDATFNKIANGNGGGAEPAGSSIYNGGFSADPNTQGATFAVADSTPLANLQTLVFQLDIGQAFGYDLWNGALPTLTYTTSAGVFNAAASFFGTLVKYDTGESVDMPIGPGGSLEAVEIYQNLYAYQFDLSGVTDPITGFAIDYIGVQHSQIYAMQLDQSDVAYSQAAYTQSAAVPEPSTVAAGALMLLPLGAGIFRVLRKERAA
jgi:hypothetical protein